MDAIQNLWDKTKKTAKFVWRHFFTLAILGICLSTFIEGRLSWKNAFYTVCICIFFDWVKQFGKFTLNKRFHYSHNDISLPLHIREPWNPSFMGTSAYASDNDFRVKYD